MKYRFIDKKTNKIICTGDSFVEIAKQTYLSPSIIREHYMDRNNENRFWQSDWRIEDDTDTRNDT